MTEWTDRQTPLPRAGRAPSKPHRGSTSSQNRTVGCDCGVWTPEPLPRFLTYFFPHPRMQSIFPSASAGPRRPAGTRQQPVSAEGRAGTHARHEDVRDRQPWPSPATLKKLEIPGPMPSTHLSHRLAPVSPHLWHSTDENAEATGRVLDPAPRPPPRGEANAGSPLKSKGEKNPAEACFLIFFLFFFFPTVQLSPNEN